MVFFFLAKTYGRTRADGEARKEPAWATFNVGKEEQ